MIDNYYLHSQDIVPTVESNYSSYLNSKSQRHDLQSCRPLEYYYEAIKVDMNTSGYYMFSSASNLDTYAYLYKHQFNPYSFEGTSLAQNDNSCEDRQFVITAYLHVNITYVLVITTSYNDRNVQGSFSVIVKGPDGMNMRRIGMYAYF